MIFTYRGLHKTGTFWLKLNTINFEGNAMEKIFRTTRGDNARTYCGNPTRILLTGYETFLR